MRLLAITASLAAGGTTSKLRESCRLAPLGLYLSLQSRRGRSMPAAYLTRAPTGLSRPFLEGSTSSVKNKTNKARKLHRRHVQATSCRPSHAKARFRFLYRETWPSRLSSVFATTVVPSVTRRHEPLDGKPTLTSFRPLVLDERERQPLCVVHERP